MVDMNGIEKKTRRIRRLLLQKETVCISRVMHTVE